MRKLSVIAAIPFFAGCLCAQSEQRTTTENSTTTTTTINGTLYDEGCRTTKTRQTETKSDQNATTRTETNRETTDCPVSTTTTSFGLMTPEGKYVRLDDAGNTRIVEMMKKNKDWTTSVTEHRPVRVRVVGSRNGDVVVVKEIQ